jgi:hypothetical protein
MSQCVLNDNGWDEWMVVTYGHGYIAETGCEDKEGCTWVMLKVRSLV